MAMFIYGLVVFTALCMSSTLSFVSGNARDDIDGITDELKKFENNLQGREVETNGVDALDGEPDVSKRAGQVFGLGGRCGWYNDKCSAFATHCCDPWRCKYRKWNHRFSKTGGRCM